MQVNMTFYVVFYFYWWDVCTSCKPLFDWVSEYWCSEKCYQYFLKKVTSVRLGIPYCIWKNEVEMFCGVHWALILLYVLDYKAHMLRRAEAGSELILCQQVPLKVKADEAYCIVSSSGITESVSYSGLLLRHISSLPCSDTVIFPYNHCDVYR